MLKGVSPYVSPDLLKALCEMGHGDEILLADAHFPGHSLGRRILRADGLSIPTLLDAMLPLIDLDIHAYSLIMMQTDPEDALDMGIEADYMRVVHKHAPATSLPGRIGRQAFYERARNAYVILITGELRGYANLILRKGVTLVE